MSLQADSTETCRQTPEAGETLDGSVPSAEEGTRSCRHLHLRLLASRTVRQYISSLKKKKFFLMFIFERERETQNPKRAQGSELSAQSPTWGSNSRTSGS